MKPNLYSSNTFPIDLVPNRLMFHTNQSKLCNCNQNLVSFNMIQKLIFQRNTYIYISNIIENIENLGIIVDKRLKNLYKVK